jgi:hypothetical protein
MPRPCCRFRPGQTGEQELQARTKAAEIQLLGIFSQIITNIETYPGPLQFLVGSQDNVVDRLLGLSGRCTISDSNDHDGLLQSILTNGSDYQGLDNLLVHGGSQRSQARELDLLDQLSRGLLRVDTITLWSNP